ncbi:hypothetical protein [Glaciibacter psychrotolerans]|uniref:Uncharacterized protein n=1 Tax=Glaciibacter psychrotolerans TaxID=670054 RepID=A0A7Z0ED63_9MICO|nr:hypothetical protein [Leifsonia psychrotolerans]NYJ19449.1 hypothetical protein [Leifsonia psychrotolerans]
MIIRRAFFFWQFIAVLALPLWLVVGWPIFGGGGWQVFGVFLGAVGLGVGLLIVSLLVYARKEVRTDRAVSWLDVGVLSLWHATIIAVGFYPSSASWLATVMVVLGLAALWCALGELVTAARKRMQSMMTLIEQTAQPRAAFPDSSRPDSSRHDASPNDPSVIIVQEKPTEP